MLIPTTFNENKACDIFSQMLDHDRTIFLNGEITADTAHLVKAQLLYLNQRPSDGDITLIINSPGGSVIDGFSIIDTMKSISCNVTTIISGLAASMASLIAAAGTKGKRFALPHSEVMIHDMSYGTSGKHADNLKAIEHSLRIHEQLLEFMTQTTGKDKDEIMKDISFDNYLSAQEAIDYGLIDKIYA